MFLAWPLFLAEQLQAKYAWSDADAQKPGILFSPPRRPQSVPPILEETPADALERVWRDALGTTSMGFYGSGADGERGENGVGVGSGVGGGGGRGVVPWGRLCEAIGRYFKERVLGALNRPLETSDFDLFASDAALWKKEDGPLTSQAARQALAAGETHPVDVSEVLLSRRKLKTFWKWFWQAVNTLRSTSAWSIGVAGPALGFAGFMRKDVAISLLSKAQPGTFLIRFSTSKAGALAVHYMSTSPRKRGVVVSAIVNVSPAGALSVENGSRDYHDLDDLVLSIDQLKVLHPNVRKEEVFFRPERRESWTGERAAAAAAAKGDFGRRRQSMPPM